MVTKPKTKPKTKTEEQRYYEYVHAIENKKTNDPRGDYASLKLASCLKEKRDIAVRALKYINNFDAVLLDAGSSAEYIAEAMFLLRKYLSVLTTNMGAYSAYSKVLDATRNGIVKGAGPSDNELILPGGRYDPTYEALFGPDAEQVIESFHPNITIIGVSGLLCPGDVFCHGAEEMEIKSKLWKQKTGTRLIATDWKKIGKPDAHSFGGIDELCKNADKAIVVTARPHKDVSKDLIAKFDQHVNFMKKHGIIVDVES